MTTRRRQQRRLARFSLAACSIASLPAHALVASNSGSRPIVGKPPSASSHVELIEPSTNCTVVLCGCLHGSSSSSNDVRSLLMDSEQDEDDVVVVLELCASRFADLRRAQQQQQGPPSSSVRKSNTSISNFLRMVRRTTEKKGWATGMAAAVLGSASGLQAALSGFEAGSEFITALEIATLRRYDVVLADRAVDETLRRVGSLPKVSWSMLKNGEKQWEAQALQTAVFGDSSLPSSQQISMPGVVLRNAAVQQDMMRLMLPPLILAQAVVTVGQLVLNLFGGSDVGGATSSIMDVSSLSLPWIDFSMSSVEGLSLFRDVGLELLTSWLVLLLGYNLLALPATRVILCERDDPLADGIRSACRLAVANGQDQGGRVSSPRVVAVLGLLHVNGVAQRLLRVDGNTET